MLSYHPALDVTIAIASNMENDDQTHPSDTLCMTYNAVKNHLTGSTDKCTFTVGSYYSGGCNCTGGGTTSPSSSSSSLSSSSSPPPSSSPSFSSSSYLSSSSVSAPADVNIPATMLAARASNKSGTCQRGSAFSCIETVTVKTPKPFIGEALVRVNTSSVCMCHVWMNE